MCGIVGILTKQNNAQQYLMQGIQLLQNRGYDSTGIVTFNEQQVATLTKYATDIYNKEDCIKTLEQNINLHKNCISGLGHTRWATCGPKTTLNAHPHCDMDENIFLIHNGTLEGPDQLRNGNQFLTQELINLGVNIYSQTDSELIAQFIGYYMKQGLDLMDATKKTLNINIRGTWGLAIIDRRNPTKMLLCRNGSPLHIGISSDAFFIASEKIAFQQYTDNFISLQDKEIVLLDIENVQEFHKNQLERISQIKDKEIIKNNHSLQFDSFFEQEVDEQPEALLRNLGNGSRLCIYQDDCVKLGGLEQYTQQICDIENLVIFGCGTSLYAGQYASHFFKKLQIFNTITCIEASDFQEYDLPQNNVGAVFVSQSGETKDIYHCIKICKKKGIFCIGVVNVVGSLVATSVDCGIYLNTQREVAVPASKSFSSQVTSLLMMGIWISFYKNHDQMKNLRISLKENIRQLPINFGFNLKFISDKCKDLAIHLQNENFLMVLGKGSGLSIAKEGALKIKEMTYIHAEAFSAGEMKHGPIALLEPERNKTKVILIIMDDENLQEMLLALDECKARESFTIVITNCPKRITKGDYIIPVVGQNWNLLSSFISVTVFQKLSLELCKILNLNPDKPRNLAKTVTV